MKRRTLACGLLLCLSAVAATTATAGGQVQVQIAPPAVQQSTTGVNQDAIDVVFFSGRRPLLLRLHVTIDGKSALAYRNAYVKQWFDYLDRDGDGFLNAAEAKLVPSVQALQQMTQQGFFSSGRPVPAPTLVQLDTNKDGKVSLAELAGHFERAGFVALRLADVPVQQTTSARVSQALFEHMKLTKAALGTKEKSFAAADALLKQFDLDDDETVSTGELLRRRGSR